ncbi:dual specificity protein phosphatase 22-A isoform X2 [Acipenser ruthenus]|uniref:dual specificity protein phosphatase 22-A isoform X2 n=1 Tax=Acipenser ruthenus TaxID=7906 RepID=UPI002741489D|nr:dual specificity protein phosphatase 22-A isoform X2 [Acipenser ruthenus]
MWKCIRQIIQLYTSFAAMGNGMNKVVDGLYLGNIRDSEDKDSLAKNGVTHILSVYNNAKPVLQDMTYLCIQASDSSSQNLVQHFKECISFIHESRLSGGACLVHCLAGVSRSTTVVVAYLMTVTNFSWEECLSAVKAVRSFVGPNFGFQQQLQEFQMTLVSEFRRWLRMKYSNNPFNDQEVVCKLLRQFEQQQQQQRLRNGEQSWMNHTTTVYPLPYNAYGSANSSWVRR